MIKKKVTRFKLKHKRTITTLMNMLKKKLKELVCSNKKRLTKEMKDLQLILGRDKSSLHQALKKLLECHLHQMKIFKLKEHSVTEPLTVVKILNTLQNQM